MQETPGDVGGDEGGVLAHRSFKKLVGAQGVIRRQLLEDELLNRRNLCLTHKTGLRSMVEPLSLHILPSDATGGAIIVPRPESVKRVR